MRLIAIYFKLIFPTMFYADIKIVPVWLHNFYIIFVRIFSEVWILT